MTTLFYINGYSHNDIAGFLDVPVSTVKSRLHTSRHRLKESMMAMVGDYLHENAPDEKFTSWVLENIPKLGWGTRKECTYCGALEAALTLTDHPFDYPTIMGVTGLVFRTRWYQGPADYMRWCPSSCVGEFPEEDEWFRQATGPAIPNRGSSERRITEDGAVRARCSEVHQRRPTGARVRQDLEHGSD